MSKERIEGAVQNAAGAVTTRFGKVDGDVRLQAEGITDKVIGVFKETIGQAKDAIHKAAK